MSQSEVVVAGTLKPDGTLELDQRPNLAPGRVTIVLRPAPAEDWWQFMQRARRELEATGSPFMDEKEIQTQVEWLREGDRIDDLLGRADPGRRRQEPA
jgi:hypothetical protein